MAYINFGPDSSETCMTSQSRYEYMNKLQSTIDKNLRLDNSDRSQLLLPDINENFENKGGIGSDPQRDRRILHIGRFIDSYMKLWVWDFDDTIINSRAYIWHAMDPYYILSLSDKQLTRDIPHWQYWRRLVLYLVQSGKRVGIASFGYYPIIKAYMDRIFGTNQHIFDANNIHSLARGASGERDWGNMPTNKNTYIQRLMLYYKIPSPDQVIFFDDRSSNIADAMRFGVTAIQVGHKYDMGGKRLAHRDLFGPQTMIQVSQQLQDGSCLANIKDKLREPFGWLGNRKAWKYIAQNQAWDTARRMTPNPVLIGNGDFVWDNDNHEKYTNIKKQIVNEMSPKPDLAVLEGFKSATTSSTNSGLPVCLDCQNPAANWIIGIMFFIMIAVVVGFIYKG